MGFNKGEVLPNGLYIGHGAIMAVFWDNGGGWCYKGEETCFLYYAVNENDIDHDLNNAKRSNNNICKPVGI
ncbi:hypothetical protein BS1321_11785 [Peribacillus simplex NBRC 15720 = DSM 1321]|uniref:Uncharacterized protein n=2 Tax=Peribacillus simplex TaxID=1478 RepID=A0A223EH40_9BACI|nr:hypothetical protein [Peribacillus simplex]ASS94551.1 hypothetical protein BS1321_11785 [Peribacillus simplex NBRC 15720 = DSM 1321]MED3908321.1 hypothetical protein [Peribacillus simplex]TVX76130.1 hypothetical protein FQP34_26050 [Peribacillus simplex]